MALKSLTINGQPVRGFKPDLLDYTVKLPFGTDAVPAVAGVAQEQTSSVTVTQATELPGVATITVTDNKDKDTVYTVSLAAMTVLDVMKLSLRIKSDAYDIEVQDLIDACLIDLNIAGVDTVDPDDALTMQAIKIYCKANFGYDEQADRFRAAYESLKTVMALAREYDEAEE